MEAIKQKLKEALKIQNYQIYCEIFKELDNAELNRLSELYKIDPKLSREQICNKLVEILKGKIPEEKTLLEAIENNNLAAVKYHIEIGADVNANDGEALVQSLENGHMDIAEFLVENGADILIEDYLINVIEAGRLDIVKFLVEYGSDIRADNDAALITASERGDLGIVRFLVENGADIHVNGEYPLNINAANGDLDVIEYLVENGADIHARDDEALRNSASNGHLEVVKYLVGIGADIHARDDAALRFSAAKGHLEVVKYLAGLGADIHARDEAALRNSASNGHLEVVKYLVGIGADIHARGDPALANAIKNGHVDIAKYLRSKTGSDRDIKHKLKSMMDKRWNYEIQCDVFEGLDISEIKKLATAYGIDTTLSRTKICKILGDILEQKRAIYNKIIEDSQCSNETDIAGTEIKDIDFRRLVTLKQDNKYYCFDVDDAYQNAFVQDNKKNPYTNVPFEKSELDKIRTEYDKFLAIRGKKFDKDEYEINTSLNPLVTKLFGNIPYAADTKKLQNADRDFLELFMRILEMQNVYLDVTIRDDLKQTKIEFVQKLIRWIENNDYINVAEAWIHTIRIDAINRKSKEDTERYGRAYKYYSSAIEIYISLYGDDADYTNLEQLGIIGYLAREFFDMLDYKKQDEDNKLQRIFINEIDEQKLENADWKFLRLFREVLGRYDSYIDVSMRRGLAGAKVYLLQDLIAMVNEDTRSIITKVWDDVVIVDAINRHSKEDIERYRDDYGITDTTFVETYKRIYEDATDYSNLVKSGL